MKILVAVKRVIDYNVQIRVKEDGTVVLLLTMLKCQQIHQMIMQLRKL